MEQNKEKIVEKTDPCESWPGCKKCKFPFVNVGCKKCKSKMQPGKPGTCEIWPLLLPTILIILVICVGVYFMFIKDNLVNSSKSNRFLSFGNRRNRFTIRKK